MDASEATARRGELLARCRAGDRHALEELLTPFDHEVLNMAYRLLGHSDEAQDIRQQTYLRVCRSLSGFDGRSAFRTWLLRIVVNLCRDHVRRRGADRRRVDGWSEHAAARPAVDQPGQRCAEAEQRQRVAEAVSHLPEPQREVLVLRHYHDMTLTQAAGVLGIPLSTASSRLSAALAQLADRLSPTSDDRTPCGCAEQEYER